MTIAALVRLNWRLRNVFTYLLTYWTKSKKSAAITSSLSGLQKRIPTDEFDIQTSNFYELDCLFNFFELSWTL